VAVRLTTLLSQALVAFTIELDNEWERRMPAYRTTGWGGRGVWATSLRQWSNFMRCVPPEGITVGDLENATRAPAQLHAMRRWGYVSVEGRTVRPKPGGLAAQEVWAPLPGVIEQRWRDRFSPELIDGLRAHLEPVAARLGDGLPQWLTGTYGGFSAAPKGSENLGDRTLPFSTLLSVPLQRLTLAYEERSGASLQFTANVLRLLDRRGVPIAELPRRSGVAMEALTPALTLLAKDGFLEQTTGRGRVARLTDKGAAEVAAYGETADEGLDQLRPLLEGILAGNAPLWPKLDPPPESWRSRVPRPETLPHHPMPRQGGHPDGV
jgi:predicted transcriptional regulator